jgi:hypothetical protein
MADLASVIQQLRKERDQAARTVEQLDAALAALTAVSGNSTRTRSRLSAAPRARIAAAQRARWAKARGNAGMKQTISRKNNTKAAQEAIIDATAYSVLTEEVGSARLPVSRRSKIDSRRKQPQWLLRGTLPSSALLTRSLPCALRITNERSSKL